MWVFTQDPIVEQRWMIESLGNQELSLVTILSLTNQGSPEPAFFPPIPRPLRWPMV